MRAVLVAMLTLALNQSLVLGEPAEPRDPVLHQRTTRLAEVLRCLVCQNQSIADSNAPLARDLKQQIAEQLAQGRSDAEILDYMVARYGDFVLYRPPVKWTTVALWVGPFLALLAGLFALALRLSRTAPEQPSLSDEEHARAAELLRVDTGQDGR